MNRPARCLIALGLVAACHAPARALPWPEIFDPLVLRTIHLQMSDADWQTIQNDESLSIWVPTLLWLEGEAPILVAIRRKSAEPLVNAPGFRKVSYRLDINELVSGQNWHGLRAVSLDNGDDDNVVSEGLAWHLHRQASGPEGYGYDAGRAAWVRLVINGVDTGVYVNAEQRDKRFLENRGLWDKAGTWLYEVEDIQGFEMDEGGPGDSPTFTTLCYAPFAAPAQCPTPDAAWLAANLPALVDMQGLLAMAAVDAFAGNTDAIFSHAKNFYFVDYLSGAPRLHLPWDLDSALGKRMTRSDVYAPESAYSDILLSVPQFRAQYTKILKDLMCGPFQETALHAFLDALEPVIADAVAADPNNQIGGSVSGYFDGRKQWFSERLQAVKAQVGAGSCVTAVDVAAIPGLSLSLAANPTRSDMAVAFTLADASPARLELFDMAGRRVEAREVGALGAGRHVATFGQGTKLAPGIYLVRLVQGARTLTTRAALLP
jgi:hypothetical protein